MFSKDKGMCSREESKAQTMKKLLEPNSYGGCCDAGVTFGLFDNGTEKVIERSQPSVAQLMTKQPANSGGLFGFMERVLSGEKTNAINDEKEEKTESLTQSLL